MLKIDTILKHVLKIPKLNNKLFHLSAVKQCGKPADSKDQIFQKVSCPVLNSQNKVSIIGAGESGMAVAVGLLAQRVTSHIALYDCDDERVKGEMLDLQHGSSFLNNPKIEAGADPEVMKNSRVTVLTLGDAPAKLDDDIFVFAKNNVDVLKPIVPLIFEQSPNTILLVASPVVEASTYVCSKLACASSHKIIGTGCNLDSTRFRFFMSQKYKVAGESCKGWVIGQNGLYSVVLWSTLTVGGVRLCLVNPYIGTGCDPENWREVHQKVIKADFELLKTKGHVSWAIAGNVVDIIDSILNNARKVFSLTVPAKGYYGIDSDVYCSLPCVLGEDGISEILTIPVKDSEFEELMRSVCIIEKMQSSTCM
ncbi:hypothetical protein FQR65_LT04885 [Abscondita terminalis]|nr:hypothetical protein FQR65_LT04885 [Abscondita terminalis]